MTREETVKVLSVLKVAYPGFYRNISRQDAMDVVSLWHSQLSDVPGDIVLIAINKLIATSKWPPTIAEVKDKMIGLYAEAAEKLMVCSNPEEVRIYLRILRHCRRVQTEPSVGRLVSEGRISIEAHD